MGETIRRVRVAVTVTSRSIFTVDVFDGMSRQAVREWFENNDFDPKERDIEEKVIGTRVRVASIKRTSVRPDLGFGEEGVL